MPRPMPATAVPTRRPLRSTRALGAAMRPRDEIRRELLSLIVWWSAWSLCDDYLLDFSPAFELLFLALVAVYVGAGRWCERRALARRRHWSSSFLHDADDALPPASLPPPASAPALAPAPHSPVSSPEQTTAPAPARISRI